MRFGGNRTERHRAGNESLDNFLGRFNFIQRHRNADRLDFKQSAQGLHTRALIVYQFGVFLVSRKIIGARGVLQFRNGIRRPHVFFAAHAISIFTPCFERGGQHRIIAECIAVSQHGFLCNHTQADALNLGGGTGEIFFNKIGIQAHRFENLCAAIRLIGGYTHFGHYLEQPLAD